MQQNDRDEDVARLSRRALEVAAQEDLFKACEAIESNADAMTVAQVYADAAQRAYREQKSVATMSALAIAGVNYCRRAAAAAERRGDATTRNLKEKAKAIAYNMAANSWPGWGDAGITINRTDLANALHAAAASLRLVEELGLGGNQIGNAHWLIGALHLAAGAHDAAVAAFEKSRAGFAAAGAEEAVLLAEGFRALARKAQPDTRAAGAEETAGVLAALQRKATDDAAVYAGQIETAERILLTGAD